MTSEPLAYSVPDAAAKVGVSPRTIDRCIKAGELPSRLIRSCRVILADDLRTWISNLPDAPKHN